MNAKGVISSIAVLGFMLLHANVSRATVYECNTVQITDWKDGHSVPLEKRPVNAILFDDKTADLVMSDMGQNEMARQAAAKGLKLNLFFQYIPLKIVEKENVPPGFILAVSESAGIRPASHNLIFRLHKGDKNTGMFFSFDEFNATLTGQCHIYKGKMPDMTITDACCRVPAERHSGLVCPANPACN